MIPAHYRLLYTASEISGALDLAGPQISAWAESASAGRGGDIVGIPVMRGGVYFFADLMRRIRCSVEMAPIRTKAYTGTVNAQQQSDLEIFDEGLEVNGRVVLLADDICDSGRTLRVLREHYLRRGAAEVRTAVLVHRVHAASVFAPDWTLFQYTGPEWFVGYGMDDANRWTNLPDIYLIQPRT